MPKTHKIKRLMAKYFIFFSPSLDTPGLVFFFWLTYVVYVRRKKNCAGLFSPCSCKQKKDKDWNDSDDLSEEQQFVQKREKVRGASRAL